MSEHFLHTPAQQSNYSGQASSQQGSSVQWFQSNYQYDNNQQQQQQYRQQYSSTGFEDEPPLLEELGIEPKEIVSRCKSVLMNKVKNDIIHDIDLVGAVAVLAVLGSIHLLSAKSIFGPLMGWGVVMSFALSWVLNSMAGTQSSDKVGLSWFGTYCLIGYCSLPMVVTGALGLLLPRNQKFKLNGLFMSDWLQIAGSVWSAFTTTTAIVRHCSGLESSRLLVLYPCILLYMAYALLCIN